MLNQRLGRSKNMHKQPILYGGIAELLNNFLSSRSFTKIFVLVDENTAKYCLPLLPSFEYKSISILSGEKNKNLATCQGIWQELLAAKADRKSLLINLGGGVICDMGGFAASCFKRGLAFVHIPTTLLAMVDATIGGKTGIDFEGQKNMLGLFSNAEAIFIDEYFLKTLDQRQLNSGRAEMIKHGFIANKKHLETCLTNHKISLELIKESVLIKEKIVASDPFEKGPRKTLNFGHTLGHALESLYLQEDKSLLHGEAIAQGMIWALKLSQQYADLDAGLAQTYILKLEKLYKPRDYKQLDWQKLLDLAVNDKKNEADKLLFCLMKALGEFVYDFPLTKIQILACLRPS